MATSTKLERLRVLAATLLECKTACVKDAEEWQVYDDIMTRVNNLMTEEERRLGFMAVYPIVDGQAQLSLFNGTPEECQIYVDILLDGHPEMRGNLIVLPI